MLNQRALHVSVLSHSLAVLLALIPQSCAEQHLNVSDGALSPALHPLAGIYDEARNMRLFKTCGNHF